MARLARRHSTSRKFVRAQRERARHAVDVAFAAPAAMPLGETFPRVSASWVRRFALAVILIVHGSYRHVVELLRDLFGLSLMAERGVLVDHATVHRWALKMLPVLAAVFRRRKLPVGKYWRVNETYVLVGGRWKHLYRAVDKRKSPISTVLDDQYSEGLSLTLTSSTLKAVGSKAPPIHALR